MAEKKNSDRFKDEDVNNDSSVSNDGLDVSTPPPPPPPPSILKLFPLLLMI